MIQAFVAAHYGFVPQTCWIADVKEQLGLPVRRAWNRRGEREKRCPPEKLPPIRRAIELLEARG